MAPTRSRGEAILAGAFLSLLCLLLLVDRTRQATYDGPSLWVLLTGSLLLALAIIEFERRFTPRPVPEPGWKTTIFGAGACLGALQLPEIVQNIILAFAVGLFAGWAIGEVLMPRRTRQE